MGEVAHSDKAKKGARASAQFVESVSGLDQVLSSIPSTQAGEAEGSEVQGRLQLQSNFEASLGYMRPQFKKRVSVVAGE